ncbi:hypothetical protein [Olivibacter sitiensis]|uniref:hypothetical protein n=1 Tax=Olivibacter sitiensis TaxID=376470 RepID=UPI00047F121F|nr:hypothetical protein [Olivibacter sitiensis]
MDYPLKKYLLSFILIGWCINAISQTNSSSPYSQYGLGLYRGDVLPQYRALGGVTTGIRGLNTYSSNINLANPASYSSVGITVMDAGIYMNRTILNRDGVSESSGNFALSHLAFAIPVVKRSALSFGLLPYTDMGYAYAQRETIAGDTTLMNKVYSGEGGLNKAYFGYGIQIGKYFSVGANVSYIFGQLSNIQGIELPNTIGALNTRLENKREVHGLSYDLGAQFHINLNEKTEFTLGYTNNLGQNLRATPTYAEVRIEQSSNSVVDTISYSEGNRYDIKMPQRHSLGFSVNKFNKLIIAGDVRYANWSAYREGNTNPNFQNAYGASLGFQITPNFNSTRYLQVVDYRIGLRYDKTYMKIRDQDINDMAVSAGLGLPIVSSNPSAIYRINLSAEYGQRGKASGGLVKDNYFNFNIAFMLNDRWFQRYRYD